MKKLISIILAAVIAVTGFSLSAGASSSFASICQSDYIYDLIDAATAGSVEVDLTNKTTFEKQTFDRIVNFNKDVVFAHYKFKLKKTDTLKFTMEVSKNFISEGVSAFILNEDGEYLLDFDKSKNLFSRSTRNKPRTFSKSIKLSKGTYYLIFAASSSTVGDFNLTVSASKHIEKKPVVKAQALSGGKAKLTWKKVPGATKYSVYKFSSNKFKVVKKSTTKTSYTVTGLTSGNYYYFGVKAYVNGKWTTLLPKEVVEVKAK